MNLKSIKKCIKEMSDEELNKFLLELRKKRLEVTREAGKKKAKSEVATANLSKLLSGMTDEEKEQLLKELGA